MDVKRLSVLKGEILTSELDDKLQSIVKTASKESGFPISLITILLRRTTFFRAYSGLDQMNPLRSADSCASFCQYVVKNKKPLRIADAKKSDLLPQQLIDLYGIRAYYGVPLVIDGEVVGSLCVVDTKPNDIKEEKISIMNELAEQASSRLYELSRKSTLSWPTEEQKPQASKDLWDNISAMRHEIRLALTGLSPVAQAMAQVSKASINNETVPRSLLVFPDAHLSYEDLQAAIGKLDNLLNKLKIETKK